MPAGQARRQRRMMLGKSLSDLQNLPGIPEVQTPAPETSSTPQENGTSANNVEVAIDVIGADLPPTQKPSEGVSQHMLTKKEFDRLPRFTVSPMNCCGYMDVSGIQTVICHNMNWEKILLGLHTSIIRNKENYDRLLAQSNEYTSKAYDRLRQVGDYNDLQYKLFCLQQSQADWSIRLHTKYSLAGAYIFTYTQQYAKFEMGKQLTDFCNKTKIGVASFAPPFFNPNSNNFVNTAILGLNQDVYWSYVRERLPANILSGKLT